MREWEYTWDWKAVLNFETLRQREKVSSVYIMINIDMVQGMFSYDN